MLDLPAPALADSDATGTPMLPAEWLDETMARARVLLHRDDPFMRALERQHEPLGPQEPRSVAGLSRVAALARRA